MAQRQTRSLSQRKRIRLDRERYAEIGTVCAITIAVQDRRTVFADAAIATAAVDVLRHLALATDVTVHAYCVMPDHVHIVIAPSATCDVVTFVGRFKNLVQRAAWAHGVEGHFWQRSFWDRLLRAEDDLQQVVAYVLNNPVRAGLVQQWRDYRFAGSLQCDSR